MRHESVVLDDFGRQLLRHLDGTRDRNALVETLVELVHQGVLEVADQGAPVREAGRLREQLGHACHDALPALGRQALLAG